MANKKAGQTQLRILEAARALFNSQGVQQVSTNHIASYLGISPGNLYYHFRNKGEIIVSLFADYAAAIERALSFTEDRQFTMDDKRVLLENCVQTIWQYRFIHRDIEYQLAEDERLRNSMTELFQKTACQIRTLFHQMINGGILSIEEKELQALVYNSWMVLLSWVGFIGSFMITRDKDGFSRKTIRRGIYQLLLLDKPYITDAFLQDYHKLLDEYYVEI